MFIPDPAFVASVADAFVAKIAPLLPQRTEPLPQQEWFTRKQAAHYIGATKEAFRVMLRDGLFPVHRYKGRERISRADIDNLWRAHKQYLEPKNST